MPTNSSRKKKELQGVAQGEKKVKKTERRPKNDRDVGCQKRKKDLAQNQEEGRPPVKRKGEKG